MPERTRNKLIFFYGLAGLVILSWFLVTAMADEDETAPLFGAETAVSDEEPNGEGEAPSADTKNVHSPFEMLTRKGAQYIGSETCGACHEKEVREFMQSTHARISVPGEGVEVQSCEMCHGPASLHVDASGGRGNILNPDRDTDTCFACHMEKKAEFNLPSHHPVLEGKMNCTDCHSAHGAEILPWTATSLEGVNQACFNCHQEQRGPFVWEHEAVREGCTTCHAVHGSMHAKMLVVPDSNVCLRCHTQMAFPTIGLSGHGGRLPRGTCFTAGCHTAVHGSNFDDHLRY